MTTDELLLEHLLAESLLSTLMKTPDYFAQLMLLRNAFRVLKDPALYSWVSSKVLESCERDESAYFDLTTPCDRKALPHAKAKSSKAKRKGKVTK